MKNEFELLPLTRLPGGPAGVKIIKCFDTNTFSLEKMEGDIHISFATTERDLF